jgi:hypothetical protein
LRKFRAGFECAAGSAEESRAISLIDGTTTGKRRRQISNSQSAKPGWQRAEIAGKQRGPAPFDMVLPDQRDALFILPGNR